jgi:hypothetical protein
VSTGFKEYLWDLTLPRLERFAPPGWDVCLCSAGVESARLARAAERNGWSYLASENARVAAPLNLAIERHPAARWVTKLDEDVFVPAGAFETLLAGYRAFEAEGRYLPGFVAPVINVNGFSYTNFLDVLGLAAEYAERFGELRRAITGVRIHHDPAAARWVWERSLPFDAVARRFAELPFSYEPIPHQFSIGMILFERSLWESMHGLKTGRRPPGMGVEEIGLARFCVERSRVMALVQNAFAGHFAFGPQDAGMRAALPALQAGLALSP